MLFHSEILWNWVKDSCPEFCFLKTCACLDKNEKKLIMDFDGFKYFSLSPQAHYGWHKDSQSIKNKQENKIH